MTTSVFEMANAVRELVLLEQKRLIELDELTIRQGHNVDGGLAGLRILVARTGEAARFLRELAPLEAPLQVWLDAHRIADRRVEQPLPSTGAV